MTDKPKKSPISNSNNWLHTLKFILIGLFVLALLFVAFYVFAFWYICCAPNYEEVYFQDTVEMQFEGEDFRYTFSVDSGAGWSFTHSVWITTGVVKTEKEFADVLRTFSTDKPLNAVNERLTCSGTDLRTYAPDSGYFTYRPEFSYTFSENDNIRVCILFWMNDDDIRYFVRTHSPPRISSLSVGQQS